jgi:Icc-related predicted phosphoesterase
MKILAVTDLHGSKLKYDRLYEIARQLNVDAVINSGDMLPKNGNLFDQHHFIADDLDRHFSRFDAAGIHYICYLGNDDLRIWDRLFEQTCRRHPCVHNIAQRKMCLAGTEFIGMNWVTDYPFRLKDRCRMDGPDYRFQAQFGSGLLSTEEGWAEVPDWESYARQLPTIGDELENLVRPDDMDNAIYVLHMPPDRLGLDHCMNGSTVGSSAIHEFIAAHQPKISFHGHIHESPEMSGRWKAELGRTVCVQPGQLEDEELTYVTVETETMDIDRCVEPVKDLFAF